jgi:hypothetical protein
MSRICLVGNCRTEFIFDGKAFNDCPLLLRTLKGAGQSNILRMQNSSSSLRNRNVLNRLLQAIDMPKNLPQGQIIMIYPRGAGRNSTLNRAGSSRFQLSSALRSQLGNLLSQRWIQNGRTQSSLLLNSNKCLCHSFIYY